MFASQPINRGSSSKIRQELHLPEKPATALKVLSVHSDVYNLELSVDIQHALFDFNKHLKTDSLSTPKSVECLFDFPDDSDFEVNQAHSLEEMERRFRALDELLNFIESISKKDKTRENAFFKKGEKEKLHLAIEQYKLQILETTLSYIKQRYASSKNEKEEKVAEPSLPLKLFYIVVAVGGGMAAAADGILAAITMFSGVAATIMLPLTIATAWINLRLYRAVELSSLKEEFGLEDAEQIDQLMQTKQKQVNVTTKLNRCIMSDDVAMMKDKSFLGYAKLAKAAHASINKQNEKTREYQESLPKRAGRWALGGFGAAIMGAFGYFSIQEAVIGLVAIGVAFTPPGWAILGMSIFAAACTAVAYLYAVQGLGLFNMFNPQASAVKSVKKSYDSYALEFETCDARLTKKMESTIEQQFDTVNHAYELLKSKIDTYIEKQDKMVIEQKDLNELDARLTDLQAKFDAFNKTIKQVDENNFGTCFKKRDKLSSQIEELRGLKAQLAVTTVKPAERTHAFAGLFSHRAVDRLDSGVVVRVGESLTI